MLFMKIYSFQLFNISHAYIVSPSKRSVPEAPARPFLSALLCFLMVIRAGPTSSSLRSKVNISYLMKVYHMKHIVALHA